MSCLMVFALIFCLFDGARCPVCLMVFALMSCLFDGVCIDVLFV